MENTIEFKIPNNFDKLYTRFTAIMERGVVAGIKKVSPEILELSILATSKLAAYIKAAKLAESMMEMGLPVDKMPDYIDDKTNEALDKLDVQMTLDISSL